MDTSGRAALRRLWDRPAVDPDRIAVVGDSAGDHVPATAAPARAENLAELPPTWIGVGTNDLPPSPGPSHP